MQRALVSYVSSLHPRQKESLTVLLYEKGTSSPSIAPASSKALAFAEAIRLLMHRLCAFDTVVDACLVSWFAFVFGAATSPITVVALGSILLRASQATMASVA